MLKADIDQLNKLVTVLGDAGKNVDAIDVRSVSDHMADALQGCAVAQACAQAGEFIEGAFLRVAGRMQLVGQKVTECAANIQTTDEQFAKVMDDLDVHQLGGR
ncbi:hypothetical protein [Nocardia blacklockiae]|uniref:hypothetical protein n=1 Tax=Nocardia blacklockiae TaxID=480036 RepID=UPI00189503CC|nr:hypothetical protein [Nocardia blacklockiae]MBF6176454.1 hypothetical protein [Nocardia blacklockiae]